jgi:hypothetical protein
LPLQCCSEFGRTAWGCTAQRSSPWHARTLVSTRVNASDDVRRRLMGSPPSEVKLALLKLWELVEEGERHLIVRVRSALVVPRAVIVAVGEASHRGGLNVDRVRFLVPPLRPGFERRHLQHNDLTV